MKEIVRNLNRINISFFILIYFNKVVLDGNQKCSRLRCLSNEGTINVSGEIFSVGCDNTPQRGSYFCQMHNSNMNYINSYELEEKYLKLK